jgi:hypothetical protein
MAVNLDNIKRKLNSLQNKDQKKDLLWKPAQGKQVVRIVPYKHQPDNPFVELKFHYNLNGKTYLSPSSFGRPDPIVEFSDKLKRSGDKEEWKLGRKLEPKMRTFVPVIVRGEESEGVKFWGFGKQVYQAILSYMADPDYGDITDLAQGRDIVVEFKTAEETGATYPKTDIRPKPNAGPAVDPSNKELIAKIGNQVDILELFPEATYEELKSAMDAWLHPEDNQEGDVVAHASTPAPTSTAPAPAVAPVASPSAVAAKTNATVEDVTTAFDNLFSN